jgi:RNA recognition motif-containing protein
MTKGAYSLRKRQRDADKAKKKKEKAERRMRKRQEGPGEIPLTTAEEAAGGAPSVEEAMAAIENEDSPGRSAAPVPARLFVGSLSWDTDEDGLREAFGQYGTVVDAVVVKDRDTGRSRGFGFVTMEDRKDAAKAIDELHESELDGRNIVVNVATERGR